MMVFLFVGNLRNKISILLYKELFMSKAQLFSIIICLLIRGLCCSAQTSNIAIPKFNDKYSQTVAKLESGNTDIDYREFRFSFLESKQYDYAQESFKLFDSLKKELFNQVEKRNSSKVVSISETLLSIDYTYLWAQKYLYQTYRIIGDSVNMKKYKRIELGLLTSICEGGNGHSCEACWEASQVYEEYFILDMLNAKRIKQTIAQCTGHICDNLEVKAEDGTIKNYFFEITKMLTNTQKKLDQKK